MLVCQIKLPELESILFLTLKAIALYDGSRHGALLNFLLIFICQYRGHRLTEMSYNNQFEATRSPDGLTCSIFG